MATAAPYNAPDTVLLYLCAEFHRLSAAADEAPLDAGEDFFCSLKTRRAVADGIMAIRPTSDIGRQRQAAVAIAMLEGGVYPFSPNCAPS